MDIPQIDDNFTMDANTCIRYSLRLGKIKALYSDQLHNFIEISNKNDFDVGYFEFIKEESYKNLSYALIKLAKSKGIGHKKYILMNLQERGFNNLDRLFEKLFLFDEKFEEFEIEDMRNFFKKNEKDISEFVQRAKSNIPEDNDLKLIVCCNNHRCNNMFIISDDSHFTAYSDEIRVSDYAVKILPMRNLQITMINWGLA